MADSNVSEKSEKFNSVSSYEVNSRSENVVDLMADLWWLDVPNIEYSGSDFVTEVENSVVVDEKRSQLKKHMSIDDKSGTPRIATDEKRSQLTNYIVRDDTNGVACSVADEKRSQLSRADNAKSAGVRARGEYRADSYEDIITASSLVRQSGEPNFKKCKLRVASKLNVERWEQELSNYADKQVVDLLKYGCPINFEGTGISKRRCTNHKGATQFAADIDSYLEDEISEGAVMGPLDKSPFDVELVISPLNTCPKKDSKDRRVIVDLSFPKCNPTQSVNGGIDKDSYLGERIRLRYPTVDQLVYLVRKFGQGCALYKRDLRRAYRQFPVDPADLYLLAYQWRGKFYVDRVLTMGLRSAAFLCQRYTNAVAFIARKRGISLVNYLDDFAGADTWDGAEQAFLELGNLFTELGITESPAKACAPSTRMVFLGVQFDTCKMEVSEERCVEVKTLLAQWERKVEATKRELQSLFGVLQFVAACVRPGRIFLARLLNELRECPEVGSIKVSEELRQDVRWWKEFMKVYNGVSLMPEAHWSEPDAVISCDACLDGAGGWFEGSYFHAQFPKFIKDQHLHINALEMLTLTVALKLWGRHLVRKKILMYCDNWSSVVVAQTGKARDKFLQACLREIVFTQARHGFEVKFRHIEGEKNRTPDLLSRWYLHDSFQAEFFKKHGKDNPKEVFVYEGLFEFSHKW